MFSNVSWEIRSLYSPGVKSLLLQYRISQQDCKRPNINIMSIIFKLALLSLPFTALAQSVLKTFENQIPTMYVLFLDQVQVRKPHADLI
jgi:hypothetical protein